jgi:5'-deoxynucleotidase YfbR-like HD superfamily hydrolase
MMPQNLRVLNTLESGEVTRYHAAPGVKPQTDAHHAWGVAVLAIHITAFPSLALIKECLLHDSGELITGDVPFTAKMAGSELKELQHKQEEEARAEHMLEPETLTERERAILKICDTLEGLIWCAKEETQVMFDGMHRGQVYRRWIGAYNNCYDKFFDFLSSEEWRRANDVFEDFGGHFKPETLASVEHKSSHHA